MRNLNCIFNNNEKQYKKDMENNHTKIEETEIIWKEVWKDKEKLNSEIVWLNARTGF